MFTARQSRSASSRVPRVSAVLCAFLLWPVAAPPPARGEPAHGIAMHGAPLHGAGFAQFTYVNPQAPKGGRLALGVLGTFDSLNPLIIKGVPAEGLREYVFESLLARSYDEPFALYGLIAEKVETPPDRSWVEFTLNPAARFSDGTPVRVEDVLFSHALLRDHGRPNHRYYYRKVARATRSGERTVRFEFADGGDRELPLILGLMPVLPAHVYRAETFESTGLALPVGSGPYLVEKVEPARRIVYRRDPNYWGRALNVNRGRFNFDTVSFEYFRDSATLFEGFAKGIVAVRHEDDPARWFAGYDFPAARDGRIAREAFSIETPAGMSALVLNTRRAPFTDRRVRRALNYLFDFELVNRLLYSGAYERTSSYFARSALSTHKVPASALERALLAPWLHALPASLLDGSFAMPASDGKGHNRANRRKAADLLKQAGYRFANGRLAHGETGEPLSFEILVANREQERLALEYGRMLDAAGIEARVRLVDSAQYQQRLQTFDYDVIQNSWYASLSPGNEQAVFWGSDAAGEPGSRNYAGIRDPAVDAMIGKLLTAENRKEFVAATRALDRLLLAGDYVIPLFHLPQQWVARWTQVEHPESTSLFGYQLDTWWAADPGTPAEGRR